MCICLVSYSIFVSRARVGCHERNQAGTNTISGFQTNQGRAGWGQHLVIKGERKIELGMKRWFSTFLKQEKNKTFECDWLDDSRSDVQSGSGPNLLRFCVTASELNWFTKQLDLFSFFGQGTKRVGRYMPIIEGFTPLSGGSISVTKTSATTFWFFFQFHILACPLLILFLFQNFSFF